jgi:hypothetical protein
MDVLPVSDRAMERHQSRTADLPPIRQRSLPDNDWQKGSIYVDAWEAA